MGLLDGINSSTRAGLIRNNHLHASEMLNAAKEVKIGTIQMTGVNTTERKDLSDNVADITNRAVLNTPVAQGLASAEEIENGKLGVLAKHDAKLFALKYNSANVPQIAKETNYACNNIEYAGVAGNIQAAAKKSPFAELFV